MLPLCGLYKEQDTCSNGRGSLDLHSQFTYDEVESQRGDGIYWGYTRNYGRLQFVSPKS